MAKYRRGEKGAEVKGKRMMRRKEDKGKEKETKP